jgi:hypothetical protein
MKLYQQIAKALCAYENCQKSDNSIWQNKWDALLEHIEDNILPSGSGIDNGCKIDRDASNAHKLVITFGYHHMDEHGGFYSENCGWSDYRCVLRADLALDYTVDVYGREVSCGLKEYLAELFVHELGAEHDFTDFLKEVA